MALPNLEPNVEDKGVQCVIQWETIKVQLRVVQITGCRSNYAELKRGIKEWIFGLGTGHLKIDMNGTT